MKILSRKEIKKIIREEYELVLHGLLEQKARCGEPGSEYGQQDYKPKKKKSKAPDPDYDRFYADLEKYKLLKLLDVRASKGKKYGKDYWWGSRHQGAYNRLLCAAMVAKKPEPAEFSQPKPGPQPKPPPKAGAMAKGDWCGERPWRTAPPRKDTAIFLEKNEKEALVLYTKYPNQQPRGWIKDVKEKINNRKKLLTWWARKYTKYAGRTAGAEQELAFSENILEKIIRNSGTLHKDGLKGMRNNIHKMIDCEFKHARGEIKGSSVEGGQPADSPVPRQAGQKAPTFREAIGATKTGDKFKLKMRNNVRYDPPGWKPEVTVFKAGKTYSGFVKGDNITINTNWGAQTKTKAEFVELVEKKSGGNPCSMVYCDESTITRSGKQKTFIDYLKNPRFAVA